MNFSSSTLLLVAICLIGFDILMLIAISTYFIVKWYCIKRPVSLALQGESIIYDETVKLQTQIVPLLCDHDGFKIPKSGSMSSQISAQGVDASMYYHPESINPDDVEVMKTAAKQPSLLLSLFYNISLIELTVVLTRGKNFAVTENDADASNHILTSVVLLPEGSIHHSSRGIPPNPLFKDKFTFFLTGEELRASQLKLNVWNIDKYSRKQPCGEAVVSLDEVFHGDHNLYSSSIEIWKELDAKDELTNETRSGELLASIQYLPVAERVTVTVMKGRDIKLEEFDKEIYVKASAVVNGKVIKNKKSSLVKKTPSPLFNETTSFQLQQQALTLRNMSIIMSVYAYRTRGPHRRLIGRAVVGATEIATEYGKEQWAKMVDTPRKMVAGWLELQ